MIVRGRLATTGRCATISIKGTRVAAVDEHPSDAHSAESTDIVIMPGLVDLQVNGLAGCDLNDGSVDEKVVRRLVEREWAHGVTSFCPTLTSAPQDDITERFGIIARARSSDHLIGHSLLAPHVEGPYLSPDDGPRGAHGRGFMRLPDVAELERWLASSRGALSIVTLAPELPGAINYIGALAARGIVAAIGHTSATASEIEAATGAGALLSTHLGNGCAELLHRHQNPLWPQLADQRLSASFIADGVHLPGPMLIAMLRAKGDRRSILVSDSIGTTGLPAGRYVTKDGVVLVDDDGVTRPVGARGFAGGARSLDGCVSWALHHGGLSLSVAARLASTNPARLLRLDGDSDTGPRGLLTPGSAADLALFRFDAEMLRPIATVVQGKVVFVTEEGEGAVSAEEAAIAPGSPMPPGQAKGESEDGSGIQAAPVRRGRDR